MWDYGECLNVTIEEENDTYKCVYHHTPCFDQCREMVDERRHRARLEAELEPLRSRLAAYKFLLDQLEDRASFQWSWWVLFVTTIVLLMATCGRVVKERKLRRQQGTSN
jgi:hypothetical protein